MQVAFGADDAARHVGEVGETARPFDIHYLRAEARQHAENVMRSLVEMGLPPNRVAVSAKTQAQIANNEVHLYVR